MTATTLLMMLITICTLYGFLHQKFYFTHLLYPYGIYRFRQCYPVLTSALVHANFLHFLLNLGVLYVFGNELERVLQLHKIPDYHLWLIWLSGVIAGSLIDLYFKGNHEEFCTCGASHGNLAIFAAYLILDHDYVLHLMRGFSLEHGVVLLILSAFTVYKFNEKKQQINYRSHLMGLMVGLTYGIIIG